MYLLLQCVVCWLKCVVVVKFSSQDCFKYVEAVAVIAYSGRGTGVKQTYICARLCRIVPAL